MSWAEVMKINSDMSTPLNELFQNSMRYVSSDNVISVVASNVYVSTTTKVFLTKIMNHAGVLKLRLIKDSNLNIYVYVDKNNERILTMTANSGSTYSAEFEFAKGDEIKISARAITGSGDIESISLLGMVAFGDF